MAKSTELKLYYVTGKNWHGGTQTVKTYASNVADARYNAEFILKKAGKVVRG